MRSLWKQYGKLSAKPGGKTVNQSTASTPSTPAQNNTTDLSKLYPAVLRSQSTSKSHQINRYRTEAFHTFHLAYNYYYLYIKEGIRTT